MKQDESLLVNTRNIHVGGGMDDTRMITGFQRPRAGSILRDSFGRNSDISPAQNDGFSAFPNNINSAAFKPLDKLNIMHNKTQLRPTSVPHSFGESGIDKEYVDRIMLENTSLKQDKDKLENHIRHLQEDKVSLEASHRRILRAAHEMETLLCEGAPNKHAIWERSLLAEREVVDLRRQLEVYAAEVDKVRMETNKALAAAEESSFRETAAIKQREIEVLRGDRAESDLKSVKSQLERSTEVIDELSEVKVALVAELEAQTAAVTATAAALETSRAEAGSLTAQLEKNTVELREREKELATLQIGYGSMRTLAQKTQMILAQQTREYAAMVEENSRRCAISTKALADVRTHFSNLGYRIDDLSRDAHLIKETFRSRLAAIKQNFAVSKEKFITATDEEREREIREIQKRFTEELANVRRKAGYFSSNSNRIRTAATRPHNDSIINEMAQVRKGSILRKACFTDPSHKRVRRFCLISPDQMLRWGAYENGAKRLTKQIPLAEIIRVEYGAYSNVQLWKPNRAEPPHRSFSLVTAHRSFDFIAESDWECQAWVVALSRITSAWSSQVVKSRGEFLRRRFIIKLDFYCKEKGITRKQAIIEGLRRAANSPMKVDITHGDDIVFANNAFNAQSINQLKNLKADPTLAALPSHGNQGIVSGTSTNGANPIGTGTNLKPALRQTATSVGAGMTDTAANNNYNGVDPDPFGLSPEAIKSANDRKVNFG